MTAAGASQITQQSLAGRGVGDGLPRPRFPGVAHRHPRRRPHRCAAAAPPPRRRCASLPRRAAASAPPMALAVPSTTGDALFPLDAVSFSPAPRPAGAAHPRSGRGPAGWRFPPALLPPRRRRVDSLPSCTPHCHPRVPLPGVGGGGGAAAAPAAAAAAPRLLRPPSPGRSALGGLAERSVIVVVDR